MDNRYAESIAFWQRLVTLGLSEPCFSHDLYSAANHNITFQSCQPALSDFCLSAATSEAGREMLEYIASKVGTFKIFRSGERPLALRPCDHRGSFPLVRSQLQTRDELGQMCKNLPAAQVSAWFANSLRYSSADSDDAQAAEVLDREAGGEKVEFLTYNIWGLPPMFGQGSPAPWRYPLIGKRLAKMSADIVALQEMWDPKTHAIVEESGFAHHASCGGRLIGGSGLCTLSRYPIEEIEFLPFSERMGIERFVRKGALRTLIKLPSGKKIDVYNIHLVSPPERLNYLLTTRDRTSQNRLSQLQELSDWIKTRRVSGRPVVVLGDFNVGEFELQYAVLPRLFGIDLYRLRYGNTSAECDETQLGYTVDPIENSWAKNTSPYAERLDYIWYLDENAHQVSSKVERAFVDQPLSDHYGIQTELRMF